MSCVTIFDEATRFACSSELKYTQNLQLYGLFREPGSFYESSQPLSAHMCSLHIYENRGQRAAFPHCNLFMMVKCPRLSTQ